MPDPVTDTLVDWQPDAETTDTNTPQGSSSMAPGGATELAGEIRQMKSSTRALSLDLDYERWINQYGTLARVDGVTFTLTGNGDMRTIARIGKRIRATQLGVFVYGTIAAVSYNAGSDVTQVTCVDLTASFTTDLDEVAFSSIEPYQPYTGLPATALTVDRNPLYFAATGTDTYAASPTVPITAYTTGVPCVVTFANANTGAATLNVSSLGAKSIKKQGGGALVAGDLVASQPYLLVYDGTDFRVVTGALAQFLRGYEYSNNGVTSSPLYPPRMQTGWLYGNGNGIATNIQLTVSFPSTFTRLGGFNAFCLGYNTTAPASMTDTIAWGDIAEIPILAVQGGNLNTSTAIVILRRTDGVAIAANKYYVVGWQAWGV